MGERRVTGEILTLPAAARLEYHCKMEGGRGRVALKLDGRKVLDEEIGEVTFAMPPIPAGQHALTITLFRNSLSAVGVTEIRADGEVRYRLAHDPEEEGFLAEHTLYLTLS